MAVDQALIKNLAEAAGLTISEERLDAVLRQYQGFLDIVQEIDTVVMTAETEPVINFSLESINPGVATDPSNGRR